MICWLWDGGACVWVHREESQKRQPYPSEDRMCSRCRAELTVTEGGPAVARKLTLNPHPARLGRGRRNQLMGHLRVRGVL
jgi:hypothetical protein